LREQQDP
jgi:hypothetical protein